MGRNVDHPNRWIHPHVRLMSLTKNKKLVRVASGSIPYLIAITNTRKHGPKSARKWIELSTMPATTDGQNGVKAL